MARPLRIQYPGACYHVTSRGNEKRPVFKNERDREKFLVYLESAVVRYGAVIHVWCLMDNHYHLFIETPLGNLSQIMRHINGAYTTYFNVKWKRAGHLFQGRYKAILVEADRYAAELSRYIHLNPVRGGIVDTPKNYFWSSYLSYIGKNVPPAWLKTDFVLSYFGKEPKYAKTIYRKFVEERMEKTESNSPLQAVVASTLLGSPQFIEEITEKHLGGKQDKRNIPAINELIRRPSMAEILHKVNADFAGEKLLKNIAIHCCWKYSGAKLQEIGDHFGISGAAVSQACRRLELKAKTDPHLKTILIRVRSLYVKS